MRLEMIRRVLRAVIGGRDGTLLLTLINANSSLEHTAKAELDPQKIRRFALWVEGSIQDLSELKFEVISPLPAVTITGPPQDLLTYIEMHYDNLISRNISVSVERDLTFNETTEEVCWEEKSKSR